MPERWERELGKLSTLQVSPSTRARVAAGPHGEGMPPSPRRGQRVTAGVVAFAVFGAAAALALGIFGREASVPPVGSATPALGSVSIQLRGDDSGPSAELRYGDVVAQPQVGSYCWSAAAVQRCADTALTAFAAGAFVGIPMGAPIVLDVPASLTDVSTTMVSGDNPADRIRQTRLGSPASSIQGEPGRRYLVIVTANWPEGSVQFFFPVEVTGTAPSPAPASNVGTLIATLTAPADGSMPLLSLTYDDHTARFDAQDGRWPGMTLSPIRLQVFDPRVDPDAMIAIAGNAQSVEGTLWIADGDQNLTGQSIPIDLSAGSASLPDRPGFYRLTLAGSWPTGEAGFSVAITIGAPSTDSPPPPPIAVVPDVVGLDQHDAVARLTEAGFVSVAVMAPANGPAGVVVSSDPPAGTSTAVTTTIKLTMSPNL
jgi:PASTA domain